MPGYRGVTMISRLPLAASCRLLLLMVAFAWAGLAQAQTFCSFAGAAPAISFGQVAANPSAQVDTTTQVQIQCWGNEGTVQVKACLKLSNGSPDSALLPQRRMANGTARMNYQVHRDAARTQVWGTGGSTPAGEATFRMGCLFGLCYGSATVPMYGRVQAGQSGLPAGTYQSSMRLDLTGAIDSNASCNGLNNVIDSTTVIAQANVSNSCTVAASDLAFGTHSHLASAINASTSLGVSCSVGTPYSVRMDGGTTANNVADRRMGRNGTGPAAQGVAYQLRHGSPNGPLWGDGTSGTTALGGTGTGGAQTVPVYGRVLPQAVPLPGRYEDTVTVTVQY